MTLANKYISASTFIQPKVLASTSAFGHVPFFFWIISVLKPSKIVELGTMHGYSFFAFCQASELLSESAQCYAVDTWEGDLNTGRYGEDVYDSLNNHLLNNTWSKNAHLMRMSFDDAASKFENNSVDLIFIDGCHTYEAVKNDFLRWKDKMSPRGVMMFHDTQVEREGFGVKQFWNEISHDHPNIEFHHDHGLGVLLIGSEAPEILRELAAESVVVQDAIRLIYASVGKKYELQWEVRVATREVEKKRYEIELMRGSASWRLTAPLRRLHALFTTK
jgi:hypothetical protein